MSYVKNAQGIIINTDDSHYKAILAQRDSQKQAAELAIKMQALETELVDIRDLLQQVINRK